MTSFPTRSDGTPQGRVFGEVAETYDRAHPGYPDELFEMIAAAQSWHWVDPERGLARARELLAPGGTLALWWNLPGGVSGALAVALSEVYAEIVPDMEHGHWHVQGFGLDGADEEEVALAWDGFGAVAVEHLSWEDAYDADRYVALLSTQSGHRMLDESLRTRLLDAVHDVVARHGSRVPVPYEVRIEHAQRA